MFLLKYPVRWFRHALWFFIRLTDPPRHNGPLRPGRVEVRADGPAIKQPTIPLPPGTPRHTTVKIATEKRKRPQAPDKLPGSEPPEVRRS